MDVADLGDQDRGQDGADAGQLLDGPVAGVALQAFRNAGVEQGFLGVQFVDQLQQGGHALRIGAGQRGLLQAGPAVDAEQGPSTCAAGT